jgi:hypothetical protein
MATLFTKHFVLKLQSSNNKSQFIHNLNEKLM